MVLLPLAKRLDALLVAAHCLNFFGLLDFLKNHCDYTPFQSYAQPTHIAKHKKSEK